MTYFFLMSDATTHSTPVMDSSSCDDVEEAASLGAKPKRVVITWQLKALLAGRTPLPSSRPKRKLDETESSESSEYPDSSTLEEDAESASCANGSHSEDDTKNTMASHVVSIINVDTSTTSGWTLTSHRPRNQN